MADDTHVIECPCTLCNYSHLRLLEQLDAMTDELQQIADDLADALKHGDVSNSREAWETRGLMNHAAAAVRGAAIAWSKHMTD